MFKVVSPFQLCHRKKKQRNLNLISMVKLEVLKKVMAG